MVIANQNINAMLWRALQKRGECAFTATPDGRVLDANRSGWKLLESWRRHDGRKALAALLERVRIAGAHRSEQVFIGHRVYRLQAERLPLEDHETQQPVYGIVGEELVAGGWVPLTYVRKAYRLTTREGELLNLVLLDYTNSEIGRSLGLHPLQVKAQREALHRKLARHRDPIVNFSVQPVPHWI